MSDLVMYIQARHRRGIRLRILPRIRCLVPSSNPLKISSEKLLIPRSLNDFGRKLRIQIVGSTARAVRANNGHHGWLVGSGEHRG